MPDFQDRIIQGCGTRGGIGTYKDESLPNVTCSIGLSANTGLLSSASDGYSGAVKRGTQKGQTATGTAVSGNDAFIDLSLGSSVYQNSAPVQQNALLVQCCIKY